MLPFHEMLVMTMFRTNRVCPCSCPCSCLIWRNV